VNCVLWAIIARDEGLECCAVNCDGDQVALTLSTETSDSFFTRWGTKNPHTDELTFLKAI